MDLESFIDSATHDCIRRSTFGDSPGLNLHRFAHTYSHELPDFCYLGFAEFEVWDAADFEVGRHCSTASQVHGGSYVLHSMQDVPSAYY